ncbi:MAG: Uma2 family endonuclease [Armatimonadetes bacterium]|nr:Uma2 family endonuclease [Armatimonadota bacterium]
MSSLAKPRYTQEEYLALERRADHRSEFLGGEIFAMAGVSFTHNVIVANVVGELRNRFQGGPCQPVANDQRVRVQATGLNTYPDVAVVCGEPHFMDEDRDTLLNPTVLVEVLSRSTEAYDRGEKFAHYRWLESVSDYLLISQDKVRVEHYVRQPDGQWLLSESSGLQERVHLASVDCDLLLSDVYDKVEFPPDTEPPVGARI